MVHVFFAIIPLALTCTPLEPTDLLKGGRRLRLIRGIARRGLLPVPRKLGLDNETHTTLINQTITFTTTLLLG